MNSTFSDWVILTVLLNNLEFTFNAFVTAKRQFICVTTPTFNSLATELIDEARMEDNKSSVAMAFHGKSKLTASLLLQCSHCKKAGHEEFMCYTKYPHKRKELDAAWAAKKKGKSLLSDKFSGKSFNNVKSTSDKADGNATMLSFMFVIGSHPMSVWIVDTEASDHLCSTRESFLTYKPISRSLKTANEHAQIIEKDMISLRLVRPDSDIQEVILKDVMHASVSSANLVSGRRMRAGGVSFDMRDCTLRHNNNVIEYASEVNRIFQLHLDDTPQSHAFAANRGFKVLFDTWHRRLSHLGHTNIKRLSKIVDDIDLKDLSWRHDICEPCIKAKQTRRPYNAPIERATWPLGLIHSDVVEPITPTAYDSSRWFVTLTDDFTRFTWMFPMKIKGETAKHIKDFVTLMKTGRPNYPLERLRTDFGREYLVLKDWFTANGIIWKPTSPYSPEENGVSERLNRTICEPAQAMLKDSGLISHLWPEAIKTAVYIKNRSPTCVLDMTLYEAWTGNIPDLSSLHVFSIIAWAHIPKERRQQGVKFEDHSLKCHYLGMKESSIFRVWDPESERVLESHNCFVDEGVTAYENMANIEVHSKGKTTSNSNHAVDLPSASSPSSSRPPSVSGGVSAPATPLLWSSLLQRGSLSTPCLTLSMPDTINSVSMHPSSPSVSGGASTSSRRHQSELTGSDPQVLDESSDSDELSSLNPPASAAPAPHYNLRDRSVVNKSDAHVSYAYAVIPIDDIVKPTTYKQAVESPLCDKWKTAMEDEIQSLENNNTWDIVNVPSDQHALKGCWVYKVKRDAHGQVSRYKARWVVKGYKQ